MFSKDYGEGLGYCTAHVYSIVNMSSYLGGLMTGQLLVMI